MTRSGKVTKPLMEVRKLTKECDRKRIMERGLVSRTAAGNRALLSFWFAIQISSGLITEGKIDMKCRASTTILPIAKLGPRSLITFCNGHF